tara:strand:- start:640 stop:1071 length:432 start_codon:yes stop_codon:yes gene_type:complete
MLITNTRGLSNQGWKELQKLEKKHNESVEQRLGLLLVALGLNCITEATVAEAKYRHRIFSGLVWEGEDVYHEAYWSYDDYFNYWDKVFLKLIGFGVNGLFKTRAKWVSGLTKNSRHRLKPLTSKINHDAYWSLDWSRNEKTIQ